MSARRLLAPGLVATLAVAALAAASASGSAATAPIAGASLANCDGRAFTPSQRGDVLTSKGTLTCTGDVAKQRLRTCLEQQIGPKFQTVACVTRIKLRPGRITVFVRRSCPAAASRAFRTRSFLFLRDTSGEKAIGKAISDPRAYPRLCG